MLEAVPSEDSYEESEEENKIPFQSVSLDIWDKKYRLKSKQDEFIDQDINDTYLRVAKALAEVELPKNRDIWSKKICMGAETRSNPSRQNYL
jgi:ribonucleoside-diphosphate reductase alpha chain